MDQATTPRKSQDWTSFDSYVDHDNPLYNDRLTMHQAHWIRFAAPVVEHYVPAFLAANKAAFLGHIHIIENINYIHSNQTRNLVIKLVDQNRIISNQLASHYSTIKQEFLPVENNVITLTGDIMMVSDHPTATHATMPRYLNRLALIVIGALVSSAVLLLFYPKIGIIVGFAAFVGVALVGSRVDGWKRSVSRGVQIDGV